LKYYDYAFRAISYWLEEDEEELSLYDLARLLTPKRIKEILPVKEYPSIEKTEYVEDLIKIQIKNMKLPLYYPSQVPLMPLNQVIRELLDPRDPHYYEKKSTKVDEDIVADCGAAEGLFGITILNRYKKLYIFEPLPIYQKSLKRTYEEVSSVEILPYALGEESGQVFFHFDDFAISSKVIAEPSKLVIQQKSIDELFFETGQELTYIKADVEGAELSLLRGATKSIKECKPKIAITTYHRPDHAKIIAHIIREIEPKYRIETYGCVIDGINPTYPVMLHASF
jgi:FkbM family methyltransferase